MDIRKEVINYRKTLGEIEQIKLDIEYAKTDLMPNGTQIITGMPFGGNESPSKVESTVEKFEKKTGYAQKKLNDLIYNKKLVDAQISKLNKEDRDYIAYYTEGKRITEIAIKYSVNPASVTQRIWRILNKIEEEFKQIA